MHTNPTAQREPDMPINAGFESRGLQGAAEQQRAAACVRRSGRYAREQPSGDEGSHCRLNGAAGWA